MTEDETKVIIKKLHDLYLHQDKFVTADTIHSRISYWDIYFKDFPYAVVNRAVDDWVKGHRDMPMPSDLLQACKDYKDLYACPSGNPMEWKSTAEINWEARHGVITEDHVSPKWITDMTDEFVKWLEADPKMKQQMRAEERKRREEGKPVQTDMGDSLPFEI